MLNSFSGLGSSRRHLQSGNSLSGSLHYGINSDDDIIIPQPPLPPTSVPPNLNHLNLIINCNEDMDPDDMDDDDDDDEEEIDLDSEQPTSHHHHHAIL